MLDHELFRKAGTSYQGAIKLFTKDKEPRTPEGVIQMIRRTALALFFIWTGTHTLPALADAPVNLSAYATAARYRVKAIIMEKKRDCSEIIVAEDSILIGNYIKEGKNHRTRFLKANGKELNRCRFSEGETVIVRGVVLKSGAVMAFSIQKVPETAE